MNCAESHDLLLDLAYGELEPARAAQVEEHVAGCPACRVERLQLEEARKLTSPLRELEGPSANFDEPILRAARAEAGMQADGTPGRVVEVAASVKPLGLQAARLDPHSKVQGSSRREPWWRRRAGILGSVAAAAAIAVVVISVSLSRPHGRVAPVEVEPITVRAPGAVVPDSMKDALARNDKREVAAAPPGAVPSAAPEAKADRAEAPQRKAAAAQQAPKPKAAPAQDAATPKALAKDTKREKQLVPSKAPATSGAEALQGRGTQIAMDDRDRADADGNRALAAAEESRAHSGSANETTATPEVVGGMAPTSYARQYSPPPAPAAKKAEQAQPRSADAVESDASTARRAGEYSRAAALYREAAALRKDSAPQQAAWNLAHAVECLAAGGNVAEAIAVRKELLRSFPDQQGPRAAANSALRFVPLPRDEDVPPGK
jgi:hypothetical protein